MNKLGKYEQCPRCGNFKLEWHGRAYVISVLGVATLIGGLLTLGILWIIMIPAVILVAIFKKPRYRCRSCKGTFSKEEFDLWYWDQIRKKKAETPTT